MNAQGQLRCFMNLMALQSLPPDSTGPKGTFRERLDLVRKAGFHGVQFAEPATENELSICRELGFGIAASGRVNDPADAATLAEQVAANGFECATLHVGWGLEDDAQAFQLIESILEASTRWSIPLYVETHRATIFQDMWRTVQFVRRFPELRFNGDFSHWYAGQEMVYGSFEKKFEFIQPVIDRVRFIHGRIANPGCIQVAVDADAVDLPYVNHFKQLWTACFRAFLRNLKSDDSICFTPELLAPNIYYARTFQQLGKRVEESDRWQQSLLLKRVAEQCFVCAQSS